MALTERMKPICQCQQTKPCLYVSPFYFGLVVTHFISASTIQSKSPSKIKQIRISIESINWVSVPFFEYVCVFRCGALRAHTTRHLIKYTTQNGIACNPLDPSCAILFRFQSQIENQNACTQFAAKHTIPFCRDTECVCALSSEIGITLEKSKYHSVTGEEQSHSASVYSYPYTEEWWCVLCARRAY